MAFVICPAMFMCNLPRPTIAIVETAQEFFPNWKQMGLVPTISKTAYFFTTTALMQGTGNFIWMPLVNKYGRRPVYLSHTLFISHAQSGLPVPIPTQILMGFGSGAAETMAPLSIADVFFLHERGLN
jgi:MFS family permease